MIKAEEFADCVRRDPDISNAIGKSIVAKMRVATQRRVDFSGSDTSTRVARMLLYLVMSYGKPRPEGRHGKAVIDVPLTQVELASLAVTSPPAAQRVLHRLRKSGVIATGYRSITVVDIERLGFLAYTEQGGPY